MGLRVCILDAVEGKDRDTQHPCDVQVLLISLQCGDGSKEVAGGGQGRRPRSRGLCGPWRV